jgi:RNA polymerase sigma factor (sigma-70 family)
VERLDALEASDPSRSFEDVWRRYKPAVWARLQRPTIPEDVAEDVLAEVFTTMYAIVSKANAVPPLPGRTLAKITTHAICHHVRARRRRPAHVSDEALETQAMPSSRSSPQEALRRARRERFVHLILSLMNEHDSQLIELVHFFEIPEDELAEELGLPAGTLRYRVFMARERFRALAELHRDTLGGEL